MSRPFFAFVLLLFAGSAASAQQMNSPDAPCKNAVITSESADCLYSAWREADRDLNATYTDILAHLSSLDAERLRAAERLWLQFRDANCQAERSLYEGGTAVYPVFNGCMEAATSRRLAELKAMYAVKLKLPANSSAAQVASNEGNCTKRDSSTRPDCPGALVFFQKLQAALKADDRETVANLVNYPLRTIQKGKPAKVNNRQAFLANFDGVFDESIRCAVLSANANEVWGNYSGFTVGNGAVWFDGIIPKGEVPDTKAPDYWTKYPFKVVTLNNGNNGTPCPSGPN
jgi:uncharacterized protein YecT (DUF1311 family)